MSVGLARTSGYGETMATSGYGYSRYVDCNSALALLGFILFIDILRDIIEDVTTPAEEMRKKRWARERWAWTGGRESEPDILTFVSEGGAAHLYDALPNIITPILEGWTEEGEEGSQHHHHQCRERSVCQANSHLTNNYGTAGRVLATLLSNVVSRVVSGGDEEVVRATLRAAKEGRRALNGGGLSCHDTFPHCPHHAHTHTPEHDAHTGHLYNTTGSQDQHTNSIIETKPPEINESI